MLLPTLETKNDLIEFLEIDRFTFNEITYTLCENKYYKFEIKKKNNGKRTILSPSKKLKQAQQKISELLYSQYNPRPHVHGYIKEGSRGILSNARHHTNKRWVAKLDLKDFFGQITSKRIFGLLKKHPFYFNNTISEKITKISTYKEYLPQGSPSSPIISNLICRKLDHHLAELAKKNHCSYTRYADDITFSTNKKKFPKAIISEAHGEYIAGDAITAIIVNKHGFEINHSKTRLIGNNQRQVVTGLTVNKKPNIAKGYIKHVRAIIHHWEQTNEETATDKYYLRSIKNYPSHNEKYRTPLKLVIRGMLEFIGYIKGYQSKAYINLSKRLSLLDSSYIPKKKPFKIDVYCEGKTDYIYLKSAQKYFENKGEYKNIEIILPPDVNKAYGDTNLLSFIEKHSQRTQSSLIVGIFDNDTKAASKLKPNNSYNIKDWGNNVFSILLEDIEGEQGKKVCIEDLFKEDLLIFKVTGKRFYRPSEFNTNTKIHNSESLVCSKLNSVIIDDGVFDVSTRKNVALSKTKFASLLESNTHPYGEIDFEGFRQIFSAFEEVLNLSK